MIKKVSDYLFTFSCFLYMA